MNALPFALLVVGALNVGLAGRALSNPAVARAYAETSPKAALWRKLVGVEKTVRLVRQVFAPVGLTLGLTMLGGGAFLLLR